MKTALQSRKITKEHRKANVSNWSAEVGMNENVRVKKTAPKQLTIVYHGVHPCRLSCLFVRVKREQHEHTSLFRPQIERGKKNYFRFAHCKTNKSEFRASHVVADVLFCSTPSALFVRLLLLLLLLLLLRGIIIHERSTLMWTSQSVGRFDGRIRCGCAHVTSLSEWSVVDTLVLHEIKSHNILVVRTRCILDLVHETDCRYILFFFC